MKQFPSIVLNIIIINVVVFLSSRHVVSTKVIVDDASLLVKSTSNIKLPITTTQSLCLSTLLLPYLLITDNCQIK